MEKGENVFMERYLTPIAVLLAAVIIAGAFIWGRGAGTDTEGPAGTVSIADVNTDSSPFIGDAAAPVAVALYYDYQCPFCQQFELMVTPQIIKNYVETGKVKLVFKDFQFLGQDSMDAALFGRAVFEAQPDKFHEWYLAVFTKQDDEGDAGFGDMASITELSRTIQGLDVARIQALIEEKKDEYTAAIMADRAEGASLGINGTPTVVVGDQVVSGLSPDQFYAAIAAEIEEQL